MGKPFTHNRSAISPDIQAMYDEARTLGSPDMQAAIAARDAIREGLDSDADGSIAAHAAENPQLLDPDEAVEGSTAIEARANAARAAAEAKSRRQRGQYMPTGAPARDPRRGDK